MGGSVVYYRKIFVRISAKQSEIRTQSVPDLADHIGESENFSDQGLELFCRYITGSCAGRDFDGPL